MSDWLKKRAGKRLKQDALAPQTEKKGLLGLFHKPAAAAPDEAQQTDSAAPLQQNSAETAPVQHSFLAETEALLPLLLEEDDLPAEAQTPQQNAALALQAAAWAAQLAATDKALLAETEALLTLLCEDDAEDEAEATKPQSAAAEEAETETPAETAEEAELLQSDTEAETPRIIYKADPAEKAQSTKTVQNARLAASVNRLYGLDRSAEEREKERRRAARRAKFARGVRIALALLVLVCAATVYFAYQGGWRICRVYDGDSEPVSCLSDAASIDAVLQQAGVSLRLGDLTEMQQSGAYRNIYITRAFPVTVIADRQQKVLHITGAVETVEEVLQLAGVSVGSDDLMSHTLYEAPYSDMRIVIQRVTYKEVTVTEVIPSEPRVKQSPLLKAGKTLELLSDTARDGEKQLLCRETYIDGVLTSTEVLQETVISEPVQSILLTGANVPASPINGAKYTDIPVINNIPTEYSMLIEDGVCTAYSYKPGVWGASGMYLYQGMVAVDPDKIPLGSLLYITAADGSFVYGWAIAADVCEAAVWGRVSVDCFFETYRESQLFGRHELNIYVVDQLTQADLAEFVAKEGYFVKRIPE